MAMAFSFGHLAGLFTAGGRADPGQFFHACGGRRVAGLPSTVITPVRLEGRIVIRLPVGP